MRRSTVLATTIVLGFSSISAIPTQATISTSSTPKFSKATPAMFGTGIQSENPDARFNSIDCSSTGYCVAVGSFKNAAGDQKAFTQTQTNGIWGRAMPVTFEDEDLNIGQYQELTSVSCPSLGNCVAAGFTGPLRASRAKTAFTQTQAGGIWSKAVRVIVDSSFADWHDITDFNSVSCASVNYCVAIGDSSGSAGDSSFPSSRAFLQEKINGNWKTAKLLPFVYGTDIRGPTNTYSEISCSSAGNCLAVGRFQKPYYEAGGMTLSRINGTWRDPEVDDWEMSFSSVSCASASYCVAAGSIESSRRYVRNAWTLTQTGDTWDVNGSYKKDNSDFRSISCPSVGNCVAVGFTGVSALTSTQTNGIWDYGILAQFDPGVQRDLRSADFNSVACVSAGNCVAVGQFNKTAGGQNAFTQTQTNGIWAKAKPTEFVSSILGVYSSSLRSVSCSPTGYCVAAGEFWTPAGMQAFTQTIPMKASVSVKPTISGKAKSSKKGTDKLTAKKGTWAGYPTPAVSYQWYVCTKQVTSATQTIPKTCKSVSKQTQTTFAVTSAFKGKYLAVAVKGASTGTSATTWLSKSTSKVS